MPYDIEIKDEFIRVYYWGDGGVTDPTVHTSQLIDICKKYKKYKLIIDTRDLDSILDPINFDSLGQSILDNGLSNYSKIAILCDPTNRRSFYAKFNLVSEGIKCNVFYANQTAENWLTSLIK